MMVRGNRAAFCGLDPAVIERKATDPAPELCRAAGAQACAGAAGVLQQ
jgi:hypothetical protein